MKNKRFQFAKWLSSLMVLLSICAIPVTGQSLKCGIQAAPPPNGNNPDSLILDRFGNVYDLEDLLVPPPANGPNGGGCPSGFFILTFNAAFPANLQPTVCQVFADISAMIVEHSNTLGCGDVIPSRNVNIDVMWKALAPSNILGTGTPFYSGPIDANCDEMILDRPFIKINAGIVNPLSPDIFDGRLEINADPTNEAGNIHYPWHQNWNTPVGLNEVDLYSVTLHEALHILGFASRIGFTEHSLWDRILHITDNFVPNGVSPNVIPLLTNSPGALPCTGSLNNCWVLKAPEVTAGNLPAMIANTCGPNNTLPDVVVGKMPIAAVDWANGGGVQAALSHLSETCNGFSDVYVMRGGFAPGMARRVVSQDELQILCEIGYEISMPNYNCSGCYNIANQDRNYIEDAACCFKTYYACAGDTIEVLNDELLCNDVTNGPQQMVTRVWTFPIHPAPVPNASGTGWLIHIPNNVSNITYNYTVTGCECRQHNASFDIFIEKQCPPCTFTPDPCDNLLCAGDFENFTNTTSIESRLGWPIVFQGAQVAGSPDIKVTNLANHYLFLGNFNNREAINLELQKCIEPGCMLTMSMDLSISGGFAKYLEVWGSTGRPCDATVLGANPIANSCTQATACDPAYTFEPVCIFDDEFLASTLWIDNNNPNFAHSGPYAWENLTDQNVCFLTFVPTGIGAIYVDNISATVTCEPEITCAETTDGEVCQGRIADISFVVCAPDLPEGLGQTLVTPTVVLPSSWTLIGGNLGPFSLTEGHCKTIAIQVSVPASAPLGSIETIMLSGTATGLCTTVDWSCSAEVTVVFCPPPSVFTCPCPAGGFNIDASTNSPFYDPVLGGTPFDALEAAFDYDPNNDGYIDQIEHNGCIAILGRLIVNQDLGISGCQNVKMQPCSEIVVGTHSQHSSLDLSGSTLYGCSIMWHGITVTPYAELKYKLASFSDAQFAITAIGSNSQQIIVPTRFYSSGGIFIRNHIGVYIPTSWNETVWHAAFLNNKFVGSEQGKTLLPPCDANLPNYSAQMGYAGLVTLGTSFDVGTPGQGGYVNTFRDIRNGIIAENSAWVNVYRARFDNLPGYMGVNGNPSFNFSSGVGVLLQGGLSSVSYSRFNGVGHGVYANHPFGIKVEKNQMLDVYTGIQTTGPFNFGFKENIPIGFRDFGIHAVSPTAFPPFSGFTIDGNYLNTIAADNDGIVEAGIYVFDSHNMGDAEDYRITDNRINLRSTTDGISIVSVDNCLLDGNKVNFYTHLGNQPHTTNGIGLDYSSHNELYGNTVTDYSTNALKSDFGIQANTSPANTFCCNSTVFTSWGLYFDGTCDNTLLRYQNTDGHLFNALECTARTVIGLQPDLFVFPDDNHSNKFHVGSIATHGGNIDQIQNSEFHVKTNVPLDHPETVFLPNIPGGYDPLNPKWFLVSGNDNNDCNTAGGCPPPPPPLGGEPPIRDKGLSETDDYFASGGFYGSSYGDALQWEGGLRLYKRMQQYPELIGQSATVDAFYANAGNSALGAYATVDGAIAAIRVLPAEWASAMQSAQTNIQNATGAAESQLAALASAGTWEDSMAIYRAAEQTRLAALPAYQSLMQYMHLADSLRGVRAQAAWALNQALPAADILQNNRKTVNRVYLETLGQGITDLTPAQFADMAPIAEQCPLEGGGAVYTARGLYQLHTEAHFDDRSLCGLGSLERGVQRANAPPYEALKVQPNPVFGEVLVTLPASVVGDDARVEITDIDGRVVYSNQVPKDATTLLIDVSNLPAGIYILSAIGNSKILAPVKFVVQH